MAWVHFARKEHDKALRMLLKVEFNDVYYHLDSKSLLMKVYFELDEYDAFASLVDAFKIYLRRNQTISELQKKTYHNFILLINKLMKFKLNRSAPSAAFMEELEKLRPAADIPWLRNRAEGLEQKFGKAQK
jgi:ribosome biogenesis GTPase A